MATQRLLLGRLVCPVVVSRRPMPQIVLSLVASSFWHGDRRSFSSDQKAGDNVVEVDDDPNKLFREQMLDLQEEREALFEFSPEEKTAWSNRDSTATTDHLQNTIAQYELLRQQQPQQPQGPADANHQQQQRHHQLSKQYTYEEENGSTLTHLSEDGLDVSMVDVGFKESTRRVAKARSSVVLPPEVLAAMASSSSSSTEMVGPKGPIFATAKIAGIQAAKRTSDLIPLCHPLPLDKVTIDIRLESNVVVVECECRVTHKTGVEMEALTGATVAALTIYDMVKAVSHRVTIQETTLVDKTGGKRNIVDGVEQQH